MYNTRSFESMRPGTWSVPPRAPSLTALEKQATKKTKQKCNPHYMFSVFFY
ncbi:hypothetical protein Hanom_Chr01g00045341 [Helianthus anomalus]